MSTVKELQQEAKKRGFKGYSKMRKDELIALLAGGSPKASRRKSCRASRRQSSPKKVSGKCAGVNCTSDKICNPASGRCVTKKGKIGKALLEKKVSPQRVSSPKKSSPSQKDKCANIKCPVGKICNPKTGQCVLKRGKIGKELLAKQGSSPRSISKPKSKPKPQMGKAVQLFLPVHSIPNKKQNIISRARYAIFLFLNSKFPDACVAIIGGRRMASVIGAEKPWWEIVWDYHQKPHLNVPDDIIKGIKKCQSEGARLIGIPFYLIGRSGRHANFLVYDTKEHSLEHFEPNGYMGGEAYGWYDPDQTVKDIQKLLNAKLGNNFITKTYTPLDFCPRRGPQAVQHFDKSHAMEDPGGFCAHWSSYYAYLRFANPDMTPKQIIKEGMMALENNPKSFTRFIRDYAKFSTQLFDELDKVKPEDYDKVLAKYI